MNAEISACIENLQMQSLRAEQAAITGTPVITRLARNLERPLKVEDRLTQLAEERERRLEAQREEEKREEMRGVTFQPQILKVNQNVDRVGDISAMQNVWMQQRNETLEQVGVSTM
ncbi:hypothetical protein KIPB_009852 [Kipferlia bialata]|uniref:Uncharacterized protein n=1 Tax=Kipferlia bialata TaxID=797122 RepID=A0A9K3D2X0_9EUKA|nr:hypothetical protein KIPB_009852 [Kipferlia bialata]|eukprot:g9852.t1